MALGVDEELKKNAPVCFIVAMLTLLCYTSFFFFSFFKKYLENSLNPDIIEMLEVRHKEWFLEASNYKLLT